MTRLRLFRWLLIALLGLLLLFRPPLPPLALAGAALSLGLWLLLVALLGRWLDPLVQRAMEVRR